VFLIEDLGMVVLWLIATVLAVNGLFLSFVFYRRAARKRYFEAKDAARERYQPPVTEFLANRISVEHAQDIFREAESEPEIDAIQQLLLSQVTSDNDRRVTELFFALGYIDRWAAQAFGKAKAKLLVLRSMRQEKGEIAPTPTGGVLAPFRRLKVFYVSRMIAVDHLGRLAPDYAEVFLAAALRDPAVEVRRVAVTSMGRNRHPEAIPFLVEELRRSLRVPGSVSARSAKSALICYGMDDLHLFQPFLAHSDDQLRFYLVDTIREITAREGQRGLLNKNDFPPELYTLFLEHLVSDPSADVRARSAAVVKHFRDAAAIEALRKLLRDDSDFVRLHAVRACSERYYGALADDLLDRIGDPRWRVREAAVRAVAALGPAAINRLYQRFVASQDQYASEQVADEIQRTGLFRDMLSALTSGGGDAEVAAAACKKMVLVGKTSLPLNAVLSLESPQARLILIDALSAAPTPEFMQILAHLQATDTGPVGSRAGFLLQSGRMQAFNPGGAG
jgi:HEAT repeat protein